MGVFVQKVGVDFGETYVRLYLHDAKEFSEELHSRVFSEFLQSQFRFHRKQKKVLQFSDIIAHGVIRDSETLAAYLRFILSRSGLGRFALARIEILFSVSTTCPKTTKLIWSQIFESIGISKVTFVSCAVSSAIGAGYAFPIPTVALVVHLGSSSSEVSAVSLHECLFSLPLTLTNTSLYEQVRARFFLRAKRELSSHDWEGMNLSLGSTLSQENKIDADTNRATILEAVTRSTIREYGEELLLDIEGALEKLSVEELSLCSSQGIILTGGLAMQAGVAQFLSRRLAMPVYSAMNPEMSVIRGESTLIAFLEKDESR